MRYSSDKNRNCWLWKYADRICWQNVNLLTRKICWQNLLTKNKSADKKRISADRICWQKSNLLTTKKPCRLDTSKPHLKTSHHASQAMAGAHIPSVKFNACICAWAGPSCTPIKRQPCMRLYTVEQEYWVLRITVVHVGAPAPTFCTLIKVQPYGSTWTNYGRTFLVSRITEVLKYRYM